MRTSPSRADLDMFRSLLGQQVGFRFEDDRLAFLAELLSSRMSKTGSSSAANYFAHVTNTPSEVSELARALTVSETYFRRNRDHFRAFEAVLRERQASSQRFLRILSAGSSSGEEAYSLAISLRETLADVDAWSISIRGVDLNPEVIDKARIASYTPWSLRETPATMCQKYFRKDGDRYLLSDEIRNMVSFEVGNLVRPASGLWRREAYDLVFCRNVLMYFSPDAARKVIAEIARSLAPGGFLFLGHAETLRGLSHDFHLRHSHDTFYYQRRSALVSEAGACNHHGLASSVQSSGHHDAAITPASDELPWFEAIAQASRRIERLSRQAEPGPENEPPAQPLAPQASGHKDLAPAMNLMKQERFQEALRLLSSAPGAALANSDELLLHAMLLVSTGGLVEAEKICQDLLAIDDLHAGAHYVMAICREHARDRSGAIEHSQTATYLDADFAMPHLQLGRLARRMGETSKAKRELTLALSLLSCEDAARITLFGGGFGREVLIQLCRAELDACRGEQ